MIKKLLLSFGLLLCAMTMQAQLIFQEGFNADQAKEPFELGWYEFINLQDGDVWAISHEGQHDGEGCLMITNDANVTGSWWQRAVKFRNLLFQEGKSYRLSFYLKGQQGANMSFALMQGGENCDIPLLDAQGNEFRYEIGNFNPDQYVKYTKMFYFANAQLQRDKYAEAHPGEAPLEDKFFTTLNIYNPGLFFLDDVMLEEAAIAGVAYGGDVIRVDFGYNTNIAALAKAQKIGRVIMPKDCAQVIVNGDAAAIDMIELHPDGYLYIFLAEAYLEGGETVNVSFTNPETEDMQVKYDGALTPGGVVPNFQETTTDYIEALADVASYAYEEAKYVSSEPAHGAFGLDEDKLTEFTVTFDRPVYTTENDIYNHGVVAKLDGARKEDLVIKEGQPALSETVTFGLTTETPLGKGSYTITLTDVVQEKGTETANPIVIEFEVGKIKMAEEIYTPIQTLDFSEFAAGDIPMGWVASNEGTILEQGTTAGSGPRVFTFADGGDVKNAYYFRTTAAGNASYIEYDEPVIIPANTDIRIQFLGFCWKGNGLSALAEVYDMNGNVIASQEGVFNEGVNGNTGAAAKCDKIEVPLKLDAETPVRLRITHNAVSGGYEELMFGGIVVNTYVKTDGDSPNNEVLFQELFTTTADNIVPEEATGWDMYDAGNHLAYGSNGSGASSRIFATAFKNLAKAYYCRQMGGDGYYAIRGERAEYPLTLKGGSAQISYYSAGWKTDGVEMVMQILDDNDMVIVENKDIINCNMAGNKSQAGEAQKTKLDINLPADGNYKLKYSFNGEAMVGNILIEKMGSRAAYWYKQLDDVMIPAKEELARCEGDEFAGPTRDALAEIIAKYDKTQDLHTQAEYEEVIAQVVALTKAMQARRENVVKFNSIKSDIETILANNAETKFANLNVYKELAEVYEKYKDVTAVSLDDEELAAATKSMSDNYTLLGNMIGDGVNLLTYQVATLASYLAEIDPENTAQELIVAAGNALTDDQALAKQLKLRITSDLYALIADGKDIFQREVVDPETGEVYYEPTTIDLHSYIQNSKFYSFATTHERTTIDMYPGWHCDNTGVNLRPDYGWGTYNASALHPVTDGFLGIGWEGNNGLNVWNDVTDLPVGKYNFIIGTMDRSGVGEIKDDEGNTTYNVTDSTKFLSKVFYGFVKAGSKGDANNDGVIDVADITTIAAYILDNSKVPASLDNADANGDGVIDVADITTVASIILNGPSSEGGEYTQVAEVPFNVENIGVYYNLTDCTIPNIDIPETILRIGAYIHATESFACIDNARLEMTAKDPNFNYGAAKAKIDSRLAKMVNFEINHGDPISIRYFNTENEEVADSATGCVKIALYKDGYMTVSIVR